MQPVRELDSGEFQPCDAELATAVDRARIPRDPSALSTRLFLSVAVGRAFLARKEGQQALQLADRVSKALWTAAVDHHHLQQLGCLREYGWTLVRAMHPSAPGPLHLWGEQKHIDAMQTADAPGMLPRLHSGRRIDLQRVGRCVVS